MDVMDTAMENIRPLGTGLLLVDAGGSKTDWIQVCSGETVKFTAGGINPAVMDRRSILSAVLSAADMMGVRSSSVKDIRYYGAGIAGTEQLIVLDTILKNVFPVAVVSYGSDLQLAAEACLGTEPGIACILGTGSNSGVYDGKKIVSNIRPGGYILGDEGGGSVLGKMLLADYVKDRLPQGIRKAFSEAYPGLSYDSIVANLYRGVNPSGYLASFAPFVLSYRGDSYADSLVERNLRNFIERSVLPYGDDGQDIAVAGSIGMECRVEIEALGREYGLHFTRFVKHPADALAERMSGGICSMKHYEGSGQDDL